MPKTPNKTIVIMGPTASGKSDLAILLARKYDGEIISADSRQVYRGMDIGTGKVARDTSPQITPRHINDDRHLCDGERDVKNETKQPNRQPTNGKPEGAYFSEGIRHHLLDVASPKRTYNVTHFIRDAKKAIADIQKRGKTPIICGGTGFWIQALVENNSFPAVKPNPTLRKKLEKLSAEKLFVELKKKDPQRAETIDAQNKVRLIRALEIIETLGKVPSMSHEVRDMSHDYLILVLNPDKEILHKNITTRLEKRMAQGMVSEVETLRASGTSWRRLESFGLEYKYLALYLQKKISKDEMKERLNFEIRHYAKRQITWLRRFEKQGAPIHWIITPQEATQILKKTIVS